MITGVLFNRNSYIFKGSDLSWNIIILRALDGADEEKPMLIFCLPTRSEMKLTKKNSGVPGSAKSEMPGGQKNAM